jgi:hypothetical protein
MAYFGGVGSGKSLILCITMLIQGIMHGGEYVIARQYMPELKRTTTGVTTPAVTDTIRPSPRVECHTGVPSCKLQPIQSPSKRRSLALAVHHGSRLVSFDRRLSCEAVIGGREALWLIEA